MRPSDALLIVLVLATVAGAIVAALLVARAQARQMQRVFYARLTNEGNAPSGYEVWVEPVGQSGAASGAIFEFRLDGELLAVSVLDGTNESARRAAHQPVASTPKAQANAARGVMRGELSAQAAVDILGDLLPDSASAYLRRLDSQLRAGRAAAARLERNTMKYRRLAESVTATTTSRRFDAAPKAEGAERDRATAARQGIAQTPVIAPGQQVTLELIVRSLARQPAHVVRFEVCSRSLATPEAVPERIKAGARFGDTSPPRLYAPFALIALIALGLIALLFLIARAV